MNEFEYVMVLISIIMGLGIAHILLGLGGLLDRLTAAEEKLGLGWAHSAWLARIFFWMVMFWCWEFRFSELDPEWTVGLYLFLVGYAVLLFLLAVVLVPRSWEGIGKLPRTGRRGRGRLAGDARSLGALRFNRPRPSWP